VWSRRVGRYADSDHPGQFDACPAEPRASCGAQCQRECSVMSHLHPRLRPAVCAAVVAVLMTIFVGCANDAKGTGDAPVQARRGEDSPAEVYNFPDGFGNLATKCVGPGLRGYSNRHFYDDEGKRTTANAVVVADATCT
jgi:hypothetical protein